MPIQAGNTLACGDDRSPANSQEPAAARPCFRAVLKDHPEATNRIRLIIVGEGPLRNEIEEILHRGNAVQYAWLAGARDDVPAILRMLDCFVLPSQAEGTSCTLQEAMACGLPSIATAVGGTTALIDDGITGYLVPSDDEAALAKALWTAYSAPDQLLNLGKNARKRALAGFALDSMIAQYERLFLGDI